MPRLVQIPDRCEVDNHAEETQEPLLAPLSPATLQHGDGGAISSLVIRGYRIYISCCWFLSNVNSQVVLHDAKCKFDNRTISEVFFNFLI